MDESKPTSAAAASSIASSGLKILSPQEQQMYQNQLMFLHQIQQQHQQQQQHSQQQTNIMNPNLLSLHQQHQQQQSIMSRFPSNIDAHLRPPGVRSSNFNQASIPNSSAGINNVAAVQHQMQQIQQQQAAQTVKSAAAAQAAAMTAAQAAARQGGNPKELDLAQQDALMVTNPDLKRPFASIEDAVNRLLPYHILADYEAEEEDSVLNNDSTGQVPSRQQQWDHNILSKIQEFNNTYEKQVLAFNIMTKKRCVGEFRSEERLMMEQLLLQDELQAITDIKAQNESKERATREAAEAQMRMAMAQAEQARALISRPPPNRPIMRPSVAATDDHGDDDVMHGWGGAGSSSNRNEDAAEDFLNDDDEEDEDDEEDDGELDLNERQ